MHRTLFAVVALLSIVSTRSVKKPDPEAFADSRSLFTEIRSEFRNRGRTRSDSCTATPPLPVYCTMVDWNVPSSVLSDNIASGAEMVIELQIINFKGSRSCLSWLTALKCRYIWPKCDGSGVVTRPCRSECQKFVKSCQGDSDSCNSFPTDSCYSISGATRVLGLSGHSLLLATLLTLVGGRLVV